MARWSLRTKLVAVAALALLPVLVLAGWRTYDRRPGGAGQARRCGQRLQPSSPSRVTAS